MVSRRNTKYHTNNGCKYFLKLHLILVCKYRKSLIVGSLEEDLKQILFEISKISNFKIDTMESDRDHIHLLLDYEPKVSVSSIANRLKSISTNRIWKKHFEILKQEFWKEKTFWSDGYFACSTGDVSTEAIRKYIDTQG